METAIIVDILRRAGARVIVASVETEHTVGGCGRSAKPFKTLFGQARCQIVSMQPFSYAQGSNQLDHTQPPPYVIAAAVTATSHHSLATLHRSALWREA
jgi:hypothetical protein